MSMGINYQGPVEGLKSCYDFNGIPVHAYRFARESEHVTLYTGADGVVRSIVGGAVRVISQFFGWAASKVLK